MKTLITALLFCSLGFAQYGPNGGSGGIASNSPSPGTQPNGTGNGTSRWLNALGAAVQPPITKSALPAVSYSGSAQSNPQYEYGYVSGAVNPLFGLYGGSTFAPPNITPGPRTSGIANMNGMYVTPEFWVNVYHVGSELDIWHYGNGQAYDVWVDGQYLDHYQSAYTSGTATAGAASTITLATGASTTSGFYNQCWIGIVSGTGAGQVRQIASYVGGTLVATVSAAWSTNPDNTSIYTIGGSSYVNQATPFNIDGATGNINAIKLVFSSPATRLIQIRTTYLYGLVMGPYDTITPAPPTATAQMFINGDSFIDANNGGPFANPAMAADMALMMGAQEYNDGYGGTGLCNPNAANFGLSIADRMAPPTESWQFYLTGVTAGNYTISVTYGGSTQTTGNIAYNASSATIQTDVQALSNVPASSVSVAGPGGSQYNTIPELLLIHNASGATISINTSGLTGLTNLNLSNWTGVILPNVPKDATGAPVPFLDYIQASGNDAGFTPTQIQACATQVSNFTLAKLPTAVTIFSGIVDSNGSVILSADVANNAAIGAAAALLPTINGKTPYINTFANGLGGIRWINGSSTIASPTSGDNDIFKSIIVTSHPTGNGHYYLGAREVQQLKAILGIQ